MDDTQPREEIKVSVIVSVYNKERYLSEMLDSVLVQTLEDIEVICVDDGSTDGSSGILQDYATRDARVRILDNGGENLGAAVVRNLGMHAAHGKYLSFLDSDDFFEPEMLEQAYAKAEETQADFVIFDGWFYDDATRRDTQAGWFLAKRYLPSTATFSGADCPDTLFFTTGGIAWNKLYLRDFILKNGIKFHPAHRGNDQCFTWLACACASKIAVLEESLCHYRAKATGNISSQGKQYADGGYQGTSDLYDELEQRGLLDRYRTAVYNRSLNEFYYFLTTVCDSKVFTECYDHAKDLYIRKWQPELLDRRKLFPRFDWLLRHIEAESALGFALKYRHYHEWTGNLEQILYEQCRPGSRIALYGAGDNGKKIYYALRERKDYAIAGWFDAGHASLPFPVQSPEAVQLYAFDYLMIGIENRYIYEEVKQIFATDSAERGYQIIWCPQR